MKYYHNPRCSKSRIGLEFLKSKNINPTIIEYIKTPLNPDEIEKLLTLLDMSPYELIRKNEAVFKTEIKGKDLDDSQLIDWMAKEPKLIERPVLVINGKATIGRPVENFLKLID